MPAPSVTSSKAFFAFLQWPLTVLIRQTRQMVRAINQSIFPWMSKVLDKFQLTGQNLGRVFNSISGCMCAMHLCSSEPKWPNLKLKTWPKLLLGSLPVTFALPGHVICKSASDKRHIIKRALLKRFINLVMPKVVLIRLGIYVFVNKARGGGSPKIFINTLWCHNYMTVKFVYFVTSQL
jgi:hypothetical protein